MLVQKAGLTELQTKSRLVDSYSNSSREKNTNQMSKSIGAKVTKQPGLISVRS